MCPDLDQNGKLSESCRSYSMAISCINIHREINHLLALTGALTVVVDQRRNLNFNFE